MTWGWACLIGQGVLSLYCKEKQLEDGGKGSARKTAKLSNPGSTQKWLSSCLGSRGMGISDVGDCFKRKLPGSMSGLTPEVSGVQASCNDASCIMHAKTYSSTCSAKPTNFSYFTLLYFTFNLCTLYHCIPYTLRLTSDLVLLSGLQHEAHLIYCNACLSYLPLRL